MNIEHKATNEVKPSVGALVSTTCGASVSEKELDRYKTNVRSHRKTIGVAGKVFAVATTNIKNEGSRWLTLQKLTDARPLAVTGSTEMHCNLLIHLKH